MKKGLSIVLSLVLIAALSAGCGKEEKPTDGTQTTAPKQEESGKAASESDKVMKIEFWNSAEGNVGVVINGMVDKFNETVGKEKGIQVEAVFQGGDVVETLKTLAQAGDYSGFPAVGQIYASSMTPVLSMEPHVDIDDLYAKGYEVTVKKEDIVPNFIRSYTYENRMVAMPLNTSSLLLYYNKDMFRAAGLDPEKPPKTMAEVAEYTEKLTQYDEKGNISVYGLNVQVDRYELVNFLMGIGGVNYIGDQEGGRAGAMTKLTIGEDGSLMKFLNEWEKVIQTGGYKAVNDNEKEEFGAGLSAMNFQSTSQLASMTALAKDKFELGVAPLPRCTEEDSFGGAIGGGSLMVFDNGKEGQVEAAWTFVQYMASPEAQYDLSTKTGYMPINENTYELGTYKTYLTENPYAQIAIDQMRASDPGMQEPLDIINWDMNSLVQTNLIAFAEGKVTKQECHDNIVDGFNAKLDEYHRAND